MSDFRLAFSYALGYRVKWEHVQACGVKSRGKLKLVDSEAGKNISIYL
jgi:hypothetical protein